MINSDLMWLIIAWLGYFVLHSVLASLAVKCWVAQHFPEWMPGYRLFFNFVAVVSLAIPLYLTWAIGGETVFAWKDGWQWLGNSLAVVAVIGFFYSLRHYDGSEFLGLRQLKEREQRVEDQEHFCLSPLHQHVRHPWYFFGLILIWTRDMTMAMLVSSVMMTLYFAIGSWFEERKLLRYHGEAYAEYCRRVPGLLPLPWRNLSKEEARELEQMGNEKDRTPG